MAQTKPDKLSKLSRNIQVKGDTITIQPNTAFYTDDILQKAKERFDAKTYSVEKQAIHIKTKNATKEKKLAMAYECFDELLRIQQEE